jgi:hypothetical protein
MFYLAPDGRIVSVPITIAGTTLQPGKPEDLFRTVLYGGVYSPDAAGQRFLIARPAAATETVPLEILVNPFR